MKSSYTETLEAHPGDTLLRVSQKALRAAITALRVTVYAVLTLISPFVVFGLGVLALVGFGLCGVFAFVITGTHFPFTFVLIGSVVCALLIPTFHAVMDLLLPE